MRLPHPGRVSMIRREFTDPVVTEALRRIDANHVGGNGRQPADLGGLLTSVCREVLAQERAS